ncbi:hypothetical protein AB0916_41510, partial [Streptomyces sp. NPDC005476]
MASSLGLVSYQFGLPHRPVFLPAGLVALLGRRHRPTLAAGGPARRRTPMVRGAALAHADSLIVVPEDVE